MVSYVAVISVGVLMLSVYLRSYNAPFITQLFINLPSFESTVSHIFFGFFDVKRESKNRYRIFSSIELETYNDDEKGLYLALLGEVYDVSKGKKFYGPDGDYRFFTGRDASRAFVTGDFTPEGLTDKVHDLDASDLRSLDYWVSFYKKEYIHKGRLVGQYYDKYGEPTAYKIELDKKIKDALSMKNEEMKDHLASPPCNVEWNEKLGSRVWCSRLSGGIKRDWTGVPRKLYVPGSKTYRCACININALHALKGSIQEYPNCDPDSISCHIGHT